MYDDQIDTLLDHAAGTMDARIQMRSAMRLQQQIELAVKAFIMSGSWSDFESTTNQAMEQCFDDFNAQ